MDKIILAVLSLITVVVSEVLTDGEDRTVQKKEECKMNEIAKVQFKKENSPLTLRASPCIEYYGNNNGSPHMQTMTLAVILWKQLNPGFLHQKQ